MMLSKESQNDIRYLISRNGAWLLSNPKSARFFSDCMSTPEEQKIFFQAIDAGAFEWLLFRRDVNSATAAFAKHLNDVHGMREDSAVAITKFLYDAINKVNVEIIVPRRVNRGKVATFIENGNRAFMYRDYDYAIEQYTAALEIEPENITALYNRGITYCTSSKYDTPLMIPYRYAVYTKLDAEEKNFINNIMKEHDAKKRSALASFNAILKIDPKHIATLILRADTFFSLSEFDNAMADYNTMLKIDPCCVDALICRSDIYRFGYGDMENSLADCKAVLAINPKHEDALRRVDDIASGEPDLEQLKKLFNFHPAEKL